MPNGQPVCYIKCRGCRSGSPVPVYAQSNGRWYYNHTHSAKDPSGCKAHERFNPDIDNVEDLAELVPGVVVVDGPKPVTKPEPEPGPEPEPEAVKGDPDSEPQGNGGSNDWGNW